MVKRPSVHAAILRFLARNAIAIDASPAATNAARLKASASVTMTRGRRGYFAMSDDRLVAEYLIAKRSVAAAFEPEEDGVASAGNAQTPRMRWLSNQVGVRSSYVRRRLRLETQCGPGEPSLQLLDDGDRDCWSYSCAIFTKSIGCALTVRMVIQMTYSR